MKKGSLSLSVNSSKLRDVIASGIAPKLSEYSKHLEFNWYVPSAMSAREPFTLRVGDVSDDSQEDMVRHTKTPLEFIMLLCIWIRPD